MKFTYFFILLLLFILSNFSCEKNIELIAVIKQIDNPQAKLYRYFFTNKAGNKVYFEFHYDDKVKGMDRTNPLHINQMFILFDMCQFWNTYIGGEFNMGPYLDNKALFDAIHFTPFRINSISFYEIINGEEILILQYTLNYLNHSIVGPYAITGMDTKISESKTYNHWPGGSSGYKITYPDSTNEIYINIIRGMGGADFGSYYIGLLNNSHYMSELLKVNKTPSGIDLNDRKTDRRFVFLDNEKLSEEHFYNNEGEVVSKKIYSYSGETLSSNVNSIKLFQVPGDSLKWEKRFEYNDNNKLVRIYSDDSIMNEYIYSITGLLEKDKHGNYEWETLDEGIKVKTTITASSYIDWNNMYIPELIFDNDPKTGWLESVEGAGIGQKIKIILEKESKIDEIKFMPGYFDPKWWTSNNRVKKMNIDFGKQDFNISFHDVMEIQAVKLPKEISFMEAIFTIKEVYPSGNDNDTGISEIAFYYNGKRIILQ